MHQTRRHHHYSPSSFIEILTADIPISVTNEDAAISIRRPASSNSKEIRRIHSFCMLLLFLASRGSVWFLEPPFYAWLTQRRNDFFRIDLCESDTCARKYLISAIDFYSRCSLGVEKSRNRPEKRTRASAE